MENNPIIIVSAMQYLPEDEEKFIKWWDEVHLPGHFKFKGITEIIRYKVLNYSEEYPKYLVLTKFESRDAAKVFSTSQELISAREEMKKTWGDKGLKFKWGFQIEPVKIWKR